MCKYKTVGKLKHTSSVFTTADAADAGMEGVPPVLGEFSGAYSTANKRHATANDRQQFLNGTLAHYRLYSAIQIM